MTKLADVLNKDIHINLYIFVKIIKICWTFRETSNSWLIINQLVCPTPRGRVEYFDEIKNVQNITSIYDHIIAQQLLPWGPDIYFWWTLSWLSLLYILYISSDLCSAGFQKIYRISLYDALSQEPLPRELWNFTILGYPYLVIVQVPSLSDQCPGVENFLKEILHFQFMSDLTTFAIIPAIGVINFSILVNTFHD